VFGDWFAIRPAFATPWAQYPALSAAEFPDSIRVNQTASIQYTISWYHPNGTAVYPPEAAHRREGFEYSFFFFVPDEFTVLNGDKRFAMRFADAYDPHTGTEYMITVPYSQNGTRGSVDLRMDRPTYHDRDMIRLEDYKFQTQRTGDGVILVDHRFLADEYDIRQWIAAAEIKAADPQKRYDWRYYDEDAVHVPLAGPARDLPTRGFVFDTSPPEDVYLEGKVWPDYADFLRTVIKSGGSASDYLVRPDFTQEFIDDFVRAYPEFGTGDGTSYGDSAAVPPHDSPHWQFRAGVPMHDIRCSDGMVLMKSPRGMPACLREPSAAVLGARGFAWVVDLALDQTRGVGAGQS